MGLPASASRHQQSYQHSDVAGCMCNNAKTALLCLVGICAVQCCNHLPTTLICVQMSGSEASVMYPKHSKTPQVLVRVTILPSRATSWQGSQGCKAEELTGCCTCFGMRYIADISIESLGNLGLH